MRKFFEQLLLSVASTLFIVLHATYSIAQDDVDFAHDILPVLKSRCAECHSNGNYKGGLSLEDRESLLDSGTIEVGSSEESDLFARLTSEDPDYRMPPEGERLTKEEIGRIQTWIEQGLSWPAELSLRKPTFKRNLNLDHDFVEQLDKSIHLVDAVLDQYFSANSASPPQLADDYTFIRRAKLDLIGLLPTAEETLQFVENDDPEKYKKVVDRFLSRNRQYADHWLSFWNDLLRNDYAGTGYIDGGRTQITGWLHKSLQDNKPYDQFARELINPLPESSGFGKGIKWRGRVNASQIRPLQFSQNVSQVFLGINMKCASCHDSFIDNWKLEDAYGLAAVTADEPLPMHRCDVPTGKMATSKFVFPSLGTIDGSLPREQRLEQLANLTTMPANGRFARTIVNRLWARMTGRGIVHPIDVMANQAWSEPLLDALAVDLIEHGYDLKRTLRLIATSDIYRRESVQLSAGESNDSNDFRGLHRKRMTAEQFVDAVWYLTGAFPDKPAAKIALDQSNQVSIPVRAALVNSNALMRSLGRPNREQVVTTRPKQLSTLQALDLSNGDLLADYLQQGSSRWIERKEKNSWTDDQLLEQLFLHAVSRPISNDEKQLLKISASDAGELQIQVEDTLWIIVMLPEFQLIH